MTSKDLLEISLKANRLNKKVKEIQRELTTLHCEMEARDDVLQEQFEFFCNITQYTRLP